MRSNNLVSPALKQILNNRDNFANKPNNSNPALAAIYQVKEGVEHTSRINKLSKSAVDTIGNSINSVIPSEWLFVSHDFLY